jgi:K+-sensing histidine kinase KdpD
MEIFTTTLPLAMSAAAVLAGGRLRERRRRQRLNRALHELRRPLQSFLLASGDPARLGAVLDALEELDRAINGRPPPATSQPVALRELAEDAVRSWGALAGPAARPTLRWSAGQAVVVGDRSRLARALDNLVANAVEHGRAPVEVAGTLRRGRVRIVVRDGGERRPAGGPSPNGFGPIRGRDRRDPRRGHGLEVVRDVVAAHGGRFVLRRSPSVTVAALDLPLAAPVEAAA